MKCGLCSHEMWFVFLLFVLPDEDRNFMESHDSLFVFTKLFCIGQISYSYIQMVNVDSSRYCHWSVNCQIFTYFKP